MLKLATFGLLCAVALVVAAHAREERRVAVTSGAVVAVNWLLFSMPWIDNSLSVAHILKISGIPASHEDTWAIIDLVSLIVVAWVGRGVWWSAMIWFVYLVTLTMHAVAWAGSLQYVEYAAVLDACLVVQLAALFVIGGDGCADRLLGLRDRIRFLGRSTCKCNPAIAAYEATQ